jgi:hypothetical protein
MRSDKGSMESQGSGCTNSTFLVCSAKFKALGRVIQAALTTTRAYHILLSSRRVFDSTTNNKVLSPHKHYRDLPPI